MRSLAMDGWCEVQLDGWRWHVHPDWVQILLEARGLPLTQWCDTGMSRIVKQGPHRTIWRVELPLGAVFIKHNPLQDLRAQIRQAFRVTKARGECVKALELTRRGVPTIEPLAFGETPAGESYLVTRSLEPARTIREFIEEDWPELPPQDREWHRLHLPTALAELLARMHDAGVEHADLHAGNILMQRQGDAGLLLHLIDLHAVTLGTPLDWPRSRENLVLLNRWFIQRSSRADRARFWRHYHVHRKTMTSVAEDAHQRALELERLTWESCLAFWRHRDQRYVTTNRYFYQMAGGGNRAWAVRDLDPAVLRSILGDPDAPFETARQVLKHSRSSTVAEIEIPLSGATRPAIYKRFAVTKWTDPWVHLARPTPALRSWLNGHRLLESGLPTARPLAVIHRQHLGLTQECYLLTEKLPTAMDLHTYVASLAALPEQARRDQLSHLLNQVARLVRALHARLFSHRDLKAANLLVSATPQGPRVYLIDLVGMTRHRHLSFARRAQNLARLHASFHDHPLLSRTDRLRFLRVYLAWGLHGDSGWKAWWREIAAATAAKVALNRERGRPLS